MKCMIEIRRFDIKKRANMVVKARMHWLPQC